MATQIVSSSWLRIASGVLAARVDRRASERRRIVEAVHMDRQRGGVGAAGVRDLVAERGRLAVADGEALEVVAGIEGIVAVGVDGEGAAAAAGHDDGSLRERRCRRSARPARPA